MRRWSRVLVSSLAVGLIPAVSSAQSSRSFDICGGTYPTMSSFALCAAADVSVNTIGTQHLVTIQVYNLSGLYGSDPWTSIAAVGLTNVVPTSVDVVGGSLRVTGPCTEQPGGCDYSSYWMLGNNSWLPGVSIDLNTFISSGGTDHTIISTCDPTNPLLQRTPYLYTSCWRGGPDYVTMQFETTESFDLANGGDLFFKSRIPSGPYAYCVTGASDPACVNVPPVTSAPEPASLALIASGLMGFSGFGFMRRRRKKTDDA
jgi:hypothetical protein